VPGVLPLSGDAAAPLRVDHSLRGADPGNDAALLTGPAAVTSDGTHDTACLATPGDPTRRLTAPLRGLCDAPTPLN